MRDATLLVLTITGLEPGKAIHFTSEEARGMAELDCRSLLFDRPDVPAFLAKLREYHGLRVTEQLEGGYIAARHEAAP